MRQRIRYLCIALTALSALIGRASAATILSYSFDSDAQGWTSIGFNAAGTAFVAPPLTWASSSGNPGGAVRYDAPINPPYTGFFLAPAAADTALLSALGGSVSWDLSTTHDDPNAAYLIGNGRSDISIWSGTNSIRAIVTAPSGPPVYPGFAHYSLDFNTAAGWFYNGITTAATQGQIDAVLSGADMFRIRTDYWDRSLPTSSILDNVAITSAIPEPQTYALLLAGLGLLGWQTRQRMRNG